MRPSFLPRSGQRTHHKRRIKPTPWYPTWTSQDEIAEAYKTACGEKQALCKTADVKRISVDVRRAEYVVYNNEMAWHNILYIASIGKKG